MAISATYLQTRRNCLNNSTSKHIFAFSKEMRFKNRKQHLTSNIELSKLPSAFANNSLKGALFPKFRKGLVFQDEEERARTPSPQVYSNKSSIELQKEKHVGFTMGVKLRSSLAKPLDSPGPGSYHREQSESRKQLNKSFSKAKRKFQYPKSDMKGVDSPGPTYKVEAERLKQIVAKYKNTRRTKIAKTINPEKLLEKFKKQEQQHRRIKESASQISSTKARSSTIQLDNYKTIVKQERRTVFDRQKKKSIFEPKLYNPGPGHYMYYSEFAKLQKIKSSKKSSRNTKSLASNRIKTIK